MTEETPKSPESHETDVAEQVVKRRETTHGNFLETAFVTTELKSTLQRALTDRPPRVTHAQIECLSHICTKLARITCGDPNFADHWRDIAGYALLALKEIEHEVR